MPKHNIFNKSVILITGGTGSWGNELVTQLLSKYNPKEIRIYSRGEHKQVEMKRRFQGQPLKYIIGDVRNRDRLIASTSGVDYIFHLAALKHVPICEENPWEAVQTNIMGTQNVIDAALLNKVKKVIDISTDKAVDPFNLYGVTKSCGEKLVVAANLASDSTKFVCVRGGNVMGTNGSVIPLFREQLKRLNEITITDPRMSRFLMRVQDAISLLLFASTESYGGEIFVMKMPACKISNLAEVMVKKLGNKKTKVKTIGIRPGEKLYEVLVSKYEMPNTLELKDYFVILPQIKIEGVGEHYKGKKFFKTVLDEFNSNNTYIMSKKEILSLLKIDGWLKKNGPGSDLTSIDTKFIKNLSKSEGWGK
ncbi:MAG: polysaccharide biosynthesis protein [Candidatus Paceibacterota bacterium]